jgi:integrase
MAKQYSITYPQMRSIIGWPLFRRIGNNAREIRMMDASIDKSSPVGKRDYAIFLLASRLGLRASDMCLLQFSNLDWDRNVINLVQFKTKKEIELLLLAVIGEAIIDYICNSRPKSRSVI